jgi:hypothetical protein
MAYRVMVDDNFHFMDENERYCAGEFDDAGTAMACCHRIVDEYLHSALEPSQTAEDLHASYTMFGEDPFILAIDVPPVDFSAWDYAQARCWQLCRAPCRPR